MPWPFRAFTSAPWSIGASTSAPSSFRAFTSPTLFDGALIVAKFSLWASASSASLYGTSISYGSF